jgi:hypothetical protein
VPCDEADIVDVMKTSVADETDSDSQGTKKSLGLRSANPLHRRDDDDDDDPPTAPLAGSDSDDWF